MDAVLSWAPVALLAVTSISLFLSQRWRVSIIALSLQYLAAFAVLVPLLPLGLAAVKLVVGWMSGALLGASHPGREELRTGEQPTSWYIFRLGAVALVGIGMLAVYPGLQAWIPTAASVRLAGLLLIGMGILQLGMSARPLRVTLGLLTVLTGFDVLYATLEQSVLITGLLAGVQLGLALVGAYLLAEPEEEPA